MLTFSNYKVKNLSTLTVLLLVLISLVPIMSYTFFNFYNRCSLLIISVILFIAVINLKVPIKSISPVLTFMIYSAISTTINGGGIGAIVLYTLSLFVLLITSMSTFYQLDFVVLRIVAGIIIIWLFVYSFIFRNGIFINTNTCGVYLLSSYCIWNASYNKKSVVLDFIVLVAVVYAMMNFRSRATILALIFYYALTILPVKFVKNKLFIIVTMIMAIGFVFPIVYTELFRQGVNVVILGKNLFTGREEIWLNMFQAFGKSPLSLFVGLGSTALGEGMNIHNNYYALLVDFGLIGFFIYWAYIWGFLRKSIRNLDENSRNSRWIYMFIASVLLLGITEVTTGWTSNLVLMIMGLGIASNSDNEYYKKVIALSMYEVKK